MPSKAQLPTPSATPTPTIGRARTVLPVSETRKTVKSTLKANGNILSFFQKVEVAVPATLEEGLFFADTSTIRQSSPPVILLDKERNEDQGEEAGVEDAFAEIGGARKRRRIDNFFNDGDQSKNGGVGAAWGQDSKAFSESHQRSTSEDPNTSRMSVSTVPKSEEKSRPISISRTGPFCQDEEDEESTQVPVIPFLHHEDSISHGWTDTKKETAQVKLEESMDQDDDATRLPLLRQSTSVSVNYDFDDMGDFMDDEFPEDGEEYLGRRLMEGQGNFEGEYDEFMSTMEGPLIKEEALEDAISTKSVDGADVTACPICGTSLSGVSEEVSFGMCPSTSH